VAKEDVSSAFFESYSFPSAAEKRTYSVEEIMEILDISRSTAYALIKRGLFRSVKAGKQLRISKKSFDTWLDTL